LEKINLEELQQKAWENRIIILVLAMIFLLAVGVRSDLVRHEGNYLFEPDAYYHARLIQEIVQQGHINEIDPNVYYQLPEGMVAQPPSFYHYINAIFYQIISFGRFDKELFSWSVQILPIIFGAIISIAMYFFGKATTNDKKIGVIAAFLTAVSPAFAYRTMAGAQGDNSLGFLWMVIGFLFFVRSIKSNKLEKKDLINAGLAGLFFALMALTWRMNLLIPFVLLPSIIAILFYQSVTSKKGEEDIIIHTGIKAIIALAIYTIANFVYGENWILGLIKNINSMIKIGDFNVMILASVGILLFLGVTYFFNKSDKETKEIGKFLLISILLFGLIAVPILFAMIPDPIDRSSIGALVGEESLGLTSFGMKYNSLIILPILGLIAFPIGMYLLKRKDVSLQLILWFWTIITLVMAWYKLKFTFVFGLGIVMGALLLFDFTFEALKKYKMDKSLESKIIILSLVFILLTGIGGSQIYLRQFQPFANSDPTWISAMDWIKDNTDQEAKFFNWWSDGHQLAFVTERNFSTDNRNASQTANALYAEFAVTTDINRGYEIVTQEIGADYIILQSGNFSSGPLFEWYVANKVDGALGAKYYDFSTRIISCPEVSGGVSCNGQFVDANTYNESFSAKWKQTPTEFYNGRAPIYYYGESGQLVILGNAYNNTNLAKVYFNSEETSQLYEEVFNQNGIKIFRVK